jgi:hypothetical protein
MYRLSVLNLRLNEEELHCAEALQVSHSDLSSQIVLLADHLLLHGLVLVTEQLIFPDSTSGVILGSQAMHEFICLTYRCSSYNAVACIHTTFLF